VLIRFFFLLFFTSMFTDGGDQYAERSNRLKKRWQAVMRSSSFADTTTLKPFICVRCWIKITQLAREALEGIVEGGEKLGVDVSKYKADLALK
jgi:N-acetylmuramoyl-L-alanine amidase